jgi:hypothetical protein
MGRCERVVVSGTDWLLSRFFCETRVTGHRLPPAFPFDRRGSHVGKSGGGFPIFQGHVRVGVCVLRGIVRLAALRPDGNGAPRRSRPDPAENAGTEAACHPAASPRAACREAGVGCRVREAPRAPETAVGRRREVLTTVKPVASWAYRRAYSSPNLVTASGRPVRKLAFHRVISGKSVAAILR